MKVEHFSSEFGGCMEEALKKAAQWEVEKVVPTSARQQSIAAPRAAGPKGVGATPRGAPGGPRIAATPANARAPKFGETIMSVNGSPLAAVPMSTAKLAATIKVKGSKSKLAGESNSSLLVELPSADGCVALNDESTIKSLQSDPEMKTSTIAHLQSLQSEICKVMGMLQGQA